MTSAFDFSGPSQIVAKNSEFLASRTATKKRGGPASITGISRKSDERIAAQRLAAVKQPPHFQRLNSHPVSSRDDVAKGAANAHRAAQFERVEATQRKGGQAVVMGGRTQ